MDPTILAIGGFIFFLVLLFLGLPIVVAAGLTGGIGLLITVGLGQTLPYFELIPYSEICLYSYTVFPLFILMGSIAVEGGLADNILEVTWNWMGRVPGGPAIVTVMTGAGFGAACGSNLAGAAMLTKLCYPIMKKYDYPDYFSTGCVAAAGNLVGLIPPSTLMVLFGVITGTSIAKLLIAGILPGILLAALNSGAILLMGLRDSRLRARGVTASWRERFRSLAKIWGLLFVMVLVTGGLYVGIFTPTEAGSLGVLATMVVAAINKKLSVKMLYAAVIEAGVTTAKIFVIVIGVMLFNRFLTLGGVTSVVGNFLLSLTIPPYMIFSIIVLIYLILGCFMDGASILFITLPLLFPIVTGLGYDPVWFGVCVNILIGVGFITPPVGLNCFVVKGLLPEVPLAEIFRGAWPYVITGVISIYILLIFPKIATFLPSLM